MNSEQKKARVGARVFGAIRMSLQSLIGSSSNGKTRENGATRDVCLGIEEVSTGTHHPEGRTSFAKHLRWKIGTRDVERMEITWEMAEEMMKYNRDNRPLTEATARKYGRLMKERKWGHCGKGTSEPIMFSNKGRILTGQHRLWGCILFKTSFFALVVFGEPDENFAYIDQGRRRTAGDIFSINGVPNYQMAAAVTRWLVAYEQGRMGSAHYSIVDISNEEAYAAYCGYPDMQPSIRIGLKCYREKLPHPSVAAAIHYLCARKSRELADEYFLKVATGVGFTRERDPARKVREALMTKRESRTVTRKMAAAYLITGWNRMRAGRALTRVDFDSVGQIQ